MSGKRWLIQRVNSGKYLQVEVKRKKGRFHCSPVYCAANLSSKLSGDIYFSIDSAKGLVLVEEFPLGTKADLLRLQIENRLEHLALLDVGIRAAISYKPVRKSETKQLLSVLVLPENELRDAYEALTKRKNTHLISCIPSEAGVAALLAIISPEPFIVFLVQEHKAAVIAVQKGIPLYLQAIPLIGPGEVEMEMVAHALNYCKQTLERDFRIGSAKFLCMGSNRADIDYEALGEQRWEPDWQAHITVSKEELLNYPELYGSLFIGTDFSLLPPEYRWSWNVKRVTSLALLFAGIGGVILAFLAWQNVLTGNSLHEKLQNDRNLLVQHEKELQHKLPKTQDVKQLEHYLNVLAKGTGEPQLALLIEQIVEALPEKVIIAGLKASKRGPKNSTPVENNRPPSQITPVPGGKVIISDGNKVVSDKGSAEAGLDKGIVFSLTCTSEGENDRIRARFEKAVAALSRKFVLKNIRWGYAETNMTGFFNCDIWPPREK